MNINLHIERLVIDGLPLEIRDGELAQAAVEAELMRLLSENGIPVGLEAGSSQARIRAPTLQLNPALHAKDIGARIGEGIYAAFAGLSNGHEK